MKRIFQIILFLSFSLLSTVGYSQNLLQDNPQKDVKERAKEVTDMWTRELALRPKQTALMEDKIIEFILKENVIIQSKMREEVKTRKLAELELAENVSMRDILTKPQYDLYIDIKFRNAQQKEKEKQN